MTAAELYQLTVAERRRLASLLTGLTPQQWAAESLCSVWRIREVVAHLNTSETQTSEAFEAEVTAAGGDVNLACDRTARADTARFQDVELLDIYQRRILSRWTPGPEQHQAALAHEVIHGLDITRPLGLPDPSPDVVAAAIAGAGSESVAFFGVDLTGVRLTADDVELTVGADDPDGATQVRLPAVDLTLIVTGRAPLPRRTSEGP
ncbi:maleylpyruvate isomerase family mycothiol-dependent enzyme [Pseudactinotalea suaedae]|uniref:maleylpyruvate isomerase family mycothiol-dependent enzyme n=1 Tax=Pseudactinotalea suaedae TaxID=1524924 RepID=UPI0012E1F8F3|nr:maleylpyruvate isomerase family mycothiol-dependent enzyme [Pseudactinotalea suaedae]